MGAVKAWVFYFVGLFVIGAAWLFTEPLFSMLYQIAAANGVHTTWLDLIMKIRSSSAVLIIISMTIWVFIESARTEEQTVLQ